ncbi:hypothetical protein PVK06_001886 [Gossypium arboreum]|uniref:Aminotransferase-like plant mobile domain-containing protein n=1 Tax=Gossypium arboreum TaxID=29729 RepID=A0ABR0R3I8_GOSAR|nr:hypothetical protein PVK06_001886 [Gossypium arboreum]
MAGELIRLDNKHISVDQMTMSIDRVLQCYIRNFFGAPLPLIESYLREAGFWHVATIGGECTITLEDVHLQLRLSMDGYAVTWSTSSTDWGAVCYELLGAIPDNINRDQRSEAQFQWTPYEDPAIRVVIPDEFLQNPNVWHVKVPLVNDVIVEMHQSDRDLRQAIFTIERGEATTNSCPKGMAGPFKSKKKGRRRKPINSAHTINRPNSSTGDTHIIAFSDYARGLPSQHPQLDPLPEESQPPPEADPRRNTHRRPPCGTDSDRHGH